MTQTLEIKGMMAQTLEMGKRFRKEMNVQQQFMHSDSFLQILNMLDARRRFEAIDQHLIQGFKDTAIVEVHSFPLTPLSRVMAKQPPEGVPGSLEPKWISGTFIVLFKFSSFVEPFKNAIMNELSLGIKDVAAALNINILDLIGSLDNLLPRIESLNSVFILEIPSKTARLPKSHPLYQAYYSLDGNCMEGLNSFEKNYCTIVRNGMSHTEKAINNATDVLLAEYRASTSPRYTISFQSKPYQ
jgi:hypothetical protein